MYFVPYYEEDGLKNKENNSPKNSGQKLSDAQSSVEKIVDLENVSDYDSKTERDEGENQKRGKIKPFTGYKDKG